MAEIFDKVKSSLNKGITTVGVTTASTVEKTKIKSKISNLSEDINNIYSVIGEKTYNAWEADSFNINIIISELEQINQNNIKIGELQREIKKIDEQAKNAIEASGHIPEKPAPEENQGNYICPNCEAAFASPKKFCPKCGGKMPEVKQYICANCESAYDTPVNFCKKCGCKMIDENN